MARGTLRQSSQGEIPPVTNKELSEKLEKMTKEEQDAFFADINSSSEKKAEFLRTMIGERCSLGLLASTLRKRGQI